MEYESSRYSESVSRFKFTRLWEQHSINRLAGSQQVQEASGRVHDRLPEPEIGGYIMMNGEVIAPMYVFERGPVFLEIGCNDGSDIKEIRGSLTGAIATVVGIDPNAEAVEAANDPLIQVMDVTNMDGIPTGGVDWVMAKQVLEHVPDLKKGLEEILRITAKGGIIAFSYPSEPIRGFSALSTAILGYHNPLKARELHVHKLNPGKISSMIDKSYVELDVSKFSLTPQPTWIQVFVRNEREYDAESYSVGDQGLES